MKKISFILFVLIVTIFVAMFSSCVRYKTKTTHTRDTIYVTKLDTQKVKPSDPKAPEKVKDSIRGVFIEIEKECPNLKDKLPGFQKRIEDAATIESLTGGAIMVYSPQLKDSVSIEFIGNEGTAYFRGVDTVIEDKTEIEKTVDKSTFSKALDLWPWFLLIAVVCYLLGRLKR